MSYKPGLQGASHGIKNKVNVSRLHSPRCPGLEWGSAVLRQSGSGDPAEGCAHAPTCREAATRTQAGSVRSQVVTWPPTPRLGRKRQQGGCWICHYICKRIIYALSIYWYLVCVMCHVIFIKYECVLTWIGWQSFSSFWGSILQLSVASLSGLKCSAFPQLLVWNSSSLLPVQQYSDHLAAVKAIAWSPHQHGLLASGGGTADRCLRFWNTLTGQALQSTDTGSQVCNLAWSKHANELVRWWHLVRQALPLTIPSDHQASGSDVLAPTEVVMFVCFQVSTHGYSQNQILVWKYPSLTQVAKLTGHSYRVLYLVRVLYLLMEGSCRNLSEAL